MTPNISITLNTPHVTIERYSELTGLPVDTIKTCSLMVVCLATVCVRTRSARK